MSAEIIREIQKLARRVNFKYTSLVERVTQLEANQADSAQVSAIVTLIEGLTVGLSYTVSPSFHTPIYTFPAETT